MQSIESSSAVYAVMWLDSHQHFWAYNPRDYGWMTTDMDCLRRNYLPADLAAELTTLGFGGSVAVQARQMTEETEWLLGLAERHDFIRGVVGWVDFESANLDAQLDQFAAHPKLVGVRELIHDMPDVDYVVSDVHVRAISKLAARGLTYDLLLKPIHLRPALTLARRLPSQRFVIDHVAKPLIARRQVTLWREDLRAIAECANVWCKLSGMVTEANWDDWRDEDFHVYLEVAMEAFGPRRLMIGSDWPVCTLAGGYQDVMHIVIDYVAKLSESEREDILGGTCARFYGLAYNEHAASPDVGAGASLKG